MSSTPYSGTPQVNTVLAFPAGNLDRAERRSSAIRRFETIVGALQRVLDVWAVFAAVWTATYVTADYPMQARLEGCVGFSLLLVWLLEVYGFYRPCLSLLAVRETERLLRATASAALIALPMLALLAKPLPLRSLALATLLAPLCVAVERWQAHRVLTFVRGRAKLTRKAVIVGIGPTARRIFSALAHSPRLGIEPVAFMAEPGCCADPVIYDSWYRHSHEAAVLTGPLTRKMLRRIGADLVVIAEPGLTQQEIATIQAEADECGISAYSTSEAPEESGAETEYVEVDGLMLTYRGRKRECRAYKAAKRMLDLGLAVISILLLAPVFVAAAVAVKTTTPGSVIFRQRRVGENGRLFEMYKFRSMYSDCERYARSPVSGRDPRITPVGRLLRHTCVDELPQLFNVLRGEMSLVGPRPEMPFVVEQYEALHRQRLVAKPGITGLWQLSADRRSPIHENIAYDLYYVRNRNLLMDAAILLHTVVFAFRGV